MKVLFDYQIFSLQTKGGISRYFSELATEFKNSKELEARILAPFHSNYHLNQIDPSLLLKASTWRMRWSVVFGEKREAWLNQAEALRFLGTKGQGILHETYYTHRIKGNFKRVMTIHDLIHELFVVPSEDERKVLQARKLAIEAADWIIAVSENTKKDLIRFYPNAAAKCSVVHHGYRPLPQNSSNLQINRPYILFVGNRSWYKNFEILLHVVAKTPHLKENYDIVCFGGGDINETEKDLISRLGLKQSISFKSGSDGDLHSFYQKASVLAYLSQYEGFGLPVLEAMAARCPVICSNSSSIPEVAGNAACMVNVTDETEVQNGLLKILQDVDYRQSLIAEGEKRVLEFTWKKAASETLSVYKKVLGHG
jgi:glycosyltransferase involved in cell wall biosynthesis